MNFGASEGHMNRVVEAVNSFFLDQRLDRSPGVVGVSGGADSVALLTALHQVFPSDALTVVHINHLLRGEESEADAIFVRETAESLRIRYFVERIDVSAEARESGENWEATARAIRYDRFDAIAQSLAAEWIATGHTADDQAETVLHRLLRGTGIRGLRGIAASRASDTNKTVVVRPLLTVTREDVIEHLRQLNQPFREDSTNADIAYTRNRIRRELLPLMRTFNPKIVEILGRLASQASELEEGANFVTDRLLSECVLPRAGSTIVLSVEKLAALPSYWIREIFRTIWRNEGWAADAMTAIHWERLVHIARSEPTVVDFPAGVVVRRVGNVVQLERRT